MQIVNSTNKSDEDKLREIESILEQQTLELNQTLNSIAELGDEVVHFPVEMLKELEKTLELRFNYNINTPKMLFYISA